MRKKVVVLGCGLVGGTIARDLAADDHLQVAVADLSRRNLDRVAGAASLTVLQADLGTPQGVRAVIQDCDLVVGAMPSALGMMVLRTVLECGKPFSDISFMAEDPLELDELARQRGVTAVVDCGVAPGLANLIIGHCHGQLDETTDVVYYVGGLPKEPSWPYRYKAPFAPSDVIEEYTRPARMMEGGRLVVKPALSEPELIRFEPVGLLEAFNTDGLRSLLKTIPAVNMREKTLRYPGHIELMSVLRETGYFSKEQIEVRGVRVRPLDVTARLLFPMWELREGEEEFTILRVIVEGRKGGRRLRHTFELYDEYDAFGRASSMARTTGFPCAVVARFIAEGTLRRPGVLPPELLAREPGLFERVRKELARRNVIITGKTEELAG